MLLANVFTLKMFLFNGFRRVLAKSRILSRRDFCEMSIIKCFLLFAS